MNRLNALQTHINNKAPILAYYNNTSSLSGWTTPTGYWGTNSYYSNSWFVCATSGKYIYTNTGLSSFKGTKIVFTVSVTGGCPDIFFGCNSSGAGTMYRCETRGGSNRVGFANTTAWTSWSAPSNSVSYAFPQNAWTTVTIVVNSVGVASWYLNDVPQDTGYNFTINDKGGYIGFVNDGATNFQIFTIAVYRI